MREAGRRPSRRVRQAALQLPGSAVILDFGASGPASAARPHCDETVPAAGAAGGRGVLRGAEMPGAELPGQAQATVTRRRYIVECTLDHYHRKAQINDRHHAAGMLFRAAFAEAGKTPRVVAGYAPRLQGPQDGRHRGDGGAPGAAALAAARRVARALAAVATEDRDTVVAVCGLGDWAGLGGLARLRRGLDRLAEHFRLPRAGSDGSGG